MHTKKTVCPHKNWTSIHVLYLYQVYVEGSCVPGDPLNLAENLQPSDARCFNAWSRRHRGFAPSRCCKVLEEWWLLRRMYMIVDDAWRCLMTVDDASWLLMVDGLMTVDDASWLLMVDDGWWWLMMVGYGWWLLMMLDGGWWWLMRLDETWWCLMIILFRVILIFLISSISSASFFSQGRGDEFLPTVYILAIST